jgi:16S rRNA (cytidine1402-2'-O)-methyltransferase
MKEKTIEERRKLIFGDKAPIKSQPSDKTTTSSQKSIGEKKQSTKNKTLYVIATPIGNLGDITLRAIETFTECTLLFCEDTRRANQLLNALFPENNETQRPRPKLIICNKDNELEVSKNFEKLIEAHTKIGIISDAGTPAISDPANLIVKKARELNATGELKIDVFPIVGASAVIAALSASGLSTKQFAFYGFLNRNKVDEEITTILKNDINTFAIYESPNRVVSTLKTFLKLSQKLNCEISASIFNDITKLHEKNYYGTLEKVITEIENNEKKNLGEYTLILQKTMLETTEIENEKTTTSKTLEGQIIETMLFDKLNMKQAMLKLTQNGLNKNDLYKASLNIKNLLTTK